MTEQEKQELRDAGFTDEKIASIEDKMNTATFTSLLAIMRQAVELGITLEDVQQTWKLAMLAKKKDINI